MYHLISSHPCLPQTILMAYSKAKFKSNGNKASACFKPLLIADLSDKACLPGLHYILNSDIFLLALPVAWGYQTQ